LFIQVLVSTMHQNDFSIVEKMNLKGNALIINQADSLRDEQITTDGFTQRMLTFAERGVGRSRNSALLRADADICLLADDDVRYHDDYLMKIERAFAKYPDADVILFNVPSTNSERKSAHIAKDHRVRFYNFMKYPTFQIAFRRESVAKANIFFSLLFGGGAKYSCGEDTLFLSDCLRNGLKMFACAETIGVVDHQESSWFRGFNEKYFFDKGVLFTAISKRWAIPLMVQFAVRRKHLFKNQMSILEALKHMYRGYKTYAD
jgi:glycosyltransferase involved in cell wall biosynthesis